MYSTIIIAKYVASEINKTSLVRSSYYLNKRN